MALGQTYDNNENEKYYRPSVYGYSMSNTESEIDSSRLSFSMWKGTLKIAIAPKIENSNKDEIARFDREAAALIYLNHSKARILAEILRGFLNDPTKFNQCGVNAGQGLITVSTGEEFSKTAPCLIIRKIGESGSVESSYAYEFKSKYYSTIQNFDEKTGEYLEDFDAHKTLEISQVITMLESYYNAMTGAVAFSVVDNMSFAYHLNENLNKIAGGVGVELHGGQRSSKQSTSYFANKGASAQITKRSSSTIDDIMGQDE